MEPSPAPRRLPRRSRTWIWLLAALLVVLGGMLAVVLTAPRWGTPMVRDALVERLQRRLDAVVDVGELELSWGRVVLAPVTIERTSEAGTTLQMTFDEIVVELDEDELWGGRVDVTQIEVTGGRVQGERDDYESFVRKAVERRTPDDPEKKGRVSVVPERLRVSEVWVVASQPIEDERERRVEARVDVDAAIKSKLAAVTLRDVRVDPGHGPVVTASTLHTEVQAVRDESGMGVVFPLRVDVRGGAAPMTDRIAVAGVDGWVELADANVTELSLDLEGSFSDAQGQTDEGVKLWSASGRVRRDLSEGELRLDMDAFELGRVPQVLEQLPVVESAGATVGGHLAVDVGDGVARLEGDVAIAGLKVDHRTLARTVVRDVGFELAFAAEVDPASRRVLLHYADVERDGVRVSVHGEIDHPPRRAGRRYQVLVEVPPVPCQSVIDAIPTELIPSLQGFALDGEFHLGVDLDADFADLEALVLTGDVGIWDCKVTGVPSDARAERLAGGFTHRIRLTDGRTRSIQMYPSSSSFTSLRMISPYMMQAVLTTEDGGFYKHRGFLPSQIRVALRRNLGAGQIELGASTITMQMVKNVLLSHERTLSRKVQELFVTWYVEQVLTKDRIMEIYLNAIEYGPGLYGITRAAAKYFGKHPADLTPPEAVYLALMLPSPVRRHVHYCHGELSPGFVVKVQRILRIMNERGRLSDLEYEVWKDTPVVFDLSRRGGEAACLSEIERVRAGKFTQHALSGLLPPPDGNPGSEDGGGDEGDLPDPLDGLPPPPADPAEADAPGRPAMDPEGGDTDGDPGVP